MIRMLGVWVLVSVVIGVLITAFRDATNKERWQLTKTVAFAIMCGLIASMLLGFIVILF
jgi:sensor histidine kinase regulating citrate/malate metabolism